jgi:hypothetical protein
MAMDRDKLRIITGAVKAGTGLWNQKKKKCFSHLLFLNLKYLCCLIDGSFA